MKQQKSSQHSHKSYLPLPQSKKYPRIFRLKTISLVVVILIAIIGIVDIILLINIKNNQEPSANVSFVNGIVKESDSIQSGALVEILVNGLLGVYPRFYYQYAERIGGGDGRYLTANVVRKQIFKEKGDNIMFIFYVKEESVGTTHPVAVFTSTSFPFPEKNEDYNASLTYYTFDSSSQRQSVIMSLEKKDFLIMNGTSDAEDLLKCKIFTFSEQRGHFSIFNVLQKNLKSDQISLMDLNHSFKCFHSIQNADQLKAKINLIFGIDLQLGNPVIHKYEVFRLTNSEPK